MNHFDLKNTMSSKVCTKCGGEAAGWKCSRCGIEASHFDNFHGKECGGKLRAKCAKCGHAEDNCTCKG